MPFRPCSEIGNMSDCRCVSDCWSRGREFDSCQVPYFQGNRSWKIFYSNSLPFRGFKNGCWQLQKSRWAKYWFTTKSRLPRKNASIWTDRHEMTIALDWDVKNQTKPPKNFPPGRLILFPCDKDNIKAHARIEKVLSEGSNSDNVFFLFFSWWGERGSKYHWKLKKKTPNTQCCAVCNRILARKSRNIIYDAKSMWSDWISEHW